MKIINYSQYLKNFAWDLFGTLTSKAKLTLAAARNAIERAYKFIKKRFFSLKLFWCAEEFNLSPGYHIHILMQCEGQNLTLDQKARILIAAWNRAIGVKSMEQQINVCQVRKYKENAGAEEYITKMLANCFSDYDFLGDW